jgi:hypothetical protein
VLGVVTSPPETAPPRRALMLRTLIRLGCFLAVAVAAGAAAGVAWWAVVDLPTYQVHSDGGAATTERGLSEFIAGDAWFVAIGVVVGVGLGLAGWRWLRRLGWSVVLVVAFAAVAAELVCWLVGFRLGPGDFAPRLAAAKPGDLVSIELTLRAKACLLTWPFFAVIPILLGSSLGRDDEEPRSIFPRRARS